MQQAVLETAALPLELHPYIDTPAGSRTQSKTGLKAAAFASFATGAYGGLCRIRTLKTVRFERTVSANFTRGAYGGRSRI